MKLFGMVLCAVVLSACGGGGSSETSSTSTPVAPANSAPIANAGVAQSLIAGAVVTLDGSTSTDAERDPLTYVWTLVTKPAGSTAVITTPTSAKPTFTADIAGTYTAGLVVNDGKVSSTESRVTVTVGIANVAPVANAGILQNVFTGTLVTLDGGGSSDANGDVLTYTWTLANKPAGSAATLSSPNSVKPSFIADIAGVYTASLVVNDGKLGSAATTTTITAAVLNVAPIANAGAAQTVLAGASVIVDGSASSDANGDPLTYLWTLTSKPSGSAATLTSATSPKAGFVADIGGTYVASLVVNDGKVGSNTATVAITAAAPKLTLSSVPDSFFGGTPTEYPLPYSTVSSASASVTCVGSCSNVYDVASYNLAASGKSYTITNLQATNLTTGSTVVPTFSGLTNGQSIAAGQSVTFKLQSTYTSGSTVNLKYSFVVQETGDTFSYTVQLRTN